MPSAPPSISTSSPGWSVNEASGTIPVPDIRRTPSGKSSARPSQATSSCGERLRAAVVVEPANATSAPRRTVSEMSSGSRTASRRHESRPDRTRPAVELRLGQVQCVVSLDRTARHVIAEGVARDLEARRDDEDELWLRDVPGGIRTDTDRLGGGTNTPRGRLEEELGP